MGNHLSAEQQLSSALHCLRCVIAGKSAAIDELHANNQEVGAVLDGLLSTRVDLKTALETDGYHDFLYSAPKFESKDTDLPEIERQADLISKRSEAVIQESMRLRMKVKKVQAALSANGAGHAKFPRPEFDALSKREQQVLALMVAGKTSKQIAVELGISFKTAVTHRASIMSKMEVHEVASVVREAIRRGLA
jgi:DNA-binding CsgD family transcriptional regulator